MTTTMFDFNDGKGPVRAHRHFNGGGWIADSAIVADSVYLGPNARVYDTASVHCNVKLFGNARVCGNAWVTDSATVYGNAVVFGNAKVFGNAEVHDNAMIFGDVKVNGIVLPGSVICDDEKPVSTIGTKAIITDLDINKSVSRTLVDYVKVETKEYIYYYQNSEYATNAIGSDSTLKKMADAVFVLDKIQNKLVKGKVELEQLIDFYVFRE